MWRGLYTAGAGMITETKRTDTIANNLANANTSGYKRDDAINREFAPMLIRRINDGKMQNDVTSIKGFSLGGTAPVVGTLGLGSYIGEIATDHTQGGFQTTGNPLDLAIAGDGYFAVQTPQGVRYTRDGNFYKSARGQLQTVNGQAVLDNQGRPITIPANTTQVTIGDKGQILADNQPVATLQFVQFGPDRRHCSNKATVSITRRPEPSHRRPPDRFSRGCWKIPIRMSYRKWSSLSITIGSMRLVRRL